MIASYLDNLIRFQRPSEPDPAPVNTDDPKPTPPISGFITTDDEVIECVLE